MAHTSVQPVKISVIVATYNRADYVRLWLACLLQQDYPHRRQVVIADDGSTDQTSEVIARAQLAAPDQPLVHYWQESSGYRRAEVLNKASRLADGDVLVFMDSDCLPAPDLLSVYAAHAAPASFYLGGVYALSKAFSERALRDGVGPDASAVLAAAARPENQKDHATGRVQMCYWKSSLYAALRVRRPKIWGGNFAINRDVFRQVNGFDENYVGYGQEDSDLRNRLVKGGFRAVCLHTKARAYHLWHETNLAARRQAMGDGNNRPYYRRPHVDVVCKNGLKKL